MGVGVGVGSSGVASTGTAGEDVREEDEVDLIHRRTRMAAHVNTRKTARQEPGATKPGLASRHTKDEREDDRRTVFSFPTVDRGTRSSSTACLDTIPMVYCDHNKAKESARCM